jgi:lipopolysaccharide biosynthesis glycosyltransferase
MDTFDILVLTSKGLQKDVEIILEQFGIQVKTMIMECNTIEQTVLSRFKIFDYLNISQYTKLFYLDTDILIHGDITQLFNIPTEDKIYGVNEPNMTIESIHHGGGLFDFTHVNKNTPGVNAGALIFNNTDTMKELFLVILYDVSRLTVKIPSADQAFLNYHCITKQLFGKNILDNYVFMSNKMEPVSPLSNTTYIMNHFYGGGTKLPKEKRIMYHFQHLVESLPQVNYDDSVIMFKCFAWGSGSIIFDKDGVLVTSWARGKYNNVGKNIYRATWGGILHLIIFNNNYTKYTSLRMDNMHYDGGVIQTIYKDTIPSPSEKLAEPVVGDKYLVYFCVFYNKAYLELLETLLLSLKLFSPYNENIEFLVLISPSLVSEVHTLINKLQMPIHIKTFDFQSQHEAGCARLHVFDYEFINDYSKILYLDTDIIIQGDLMKLFDSLKEEKIYAKKEYDIYGAGHGGYFFDFAKISKDTLSLNSGTLLFKNSAATRAMFYDINLHIKTLKSKTTLLPLCMDQPFIAYHLIKNSMCDLESISDYVFLSGEFNQDLNNPQLSSDAVLSHFTWPIGNATNKMTRMKCHLKSLLEDYSKRQIDSFVFLDKSYSWKDDTITFKADGLLQMNTSSHKYTMINNTTALLHINNSKFIFMTREPEKPSILPIWLDMNRLSYSLEKRLPSFNILLATVGRPTLQRMLYSLSAQLNPIDCVTIVFDNMKEVPKSFDYSTFTCKVNIYCEPVKLGYWGHGIRNKYANLLEKRDFIMHGDDDDIYPSDCFKLLRDDCTNPDILYVGKHTGKSGDIGRDTNDLTIGKCGTTSGIIPYELNKTGRWGHLIGGDGQFNKQIELKAKSIQYLSYVTYIIRPDVCHFIKNIYCFWPSTQHISEGVKGTLKKIMNVSQCNVILITPENLNTYIIKDYPLHTGYQYLSDTHKTDYLRIYFMNFYGGGYSDINEPGGSWDNAFSELYNSNYLICGYPETSYWGIAYEPYRGQYKELIRISGFVCKANTPLTNELYKEMLELVDKHLAKLVLHSQNDSSKTNSVYPIGLDEMRNVIFHKVCVKYKKSILKNLPSTT